MPLSLSWTVTGIFASFIPFIAGPNNFQSFLPSHFFRQTDSSTHTHTFTTPNADSCTALQATLPTLLFASNTSISSISHVLANSTIQTAGSCTSKAHVSSDICRVVGQVNTTESSRVKFEMWLPVNEEGWYGRVLTVGNGGLNGCIDYGNLDYGSSFHFATIASDNGHDGIGGLPFLDSPEVINDFAWRSIHTIAQLSRVIAAHYYSPPSLPVRSYYIGCSTGGRQGIHSALKFPEDFDGILAGAPAVDMQHLLGWSGMISRAVGAGTGKGRDSVQFIDEDGWDLVSEEVLRQCDALDGRMDGILTEPDECEFDPSALLCCEESEEDVEGEGNKGEMEGCLTEAQVDALKRIYSPLVGRDGETVLYPRFDPGAERISLRSRVFAPEIFSYTFDWWRYAIYNDSSRTLDDFGLEDIEFADSINPGGVATWDGDLSKFRERGGKIITYHGRMDPLIASGNSKRLYNLVSSTLSDVSNPSNPSSIEGFYRLFLIPGMSHCTGGPGASHFGQRGPSGLGTAYNDSAHNDSAHNALLALVEWVEGGRGPEVIIGTEDGDDGKVREHCRWPGWRSVWRGSDGEDGRWVCEEASGDP